MDIAFFLYEERVSVNGKEGWVGLPVVQGSFFVSPGSRYVTVALVLPAQPVVLEGLCSGYEFFFEFVVEYFLVFWKRRGCCFSCFFQNQFFVDAAMFFHFFDMFF